MQGEAWVFSWISAHSPACPCLCPCWTESLPWTSEPCCLCTSGRWQEGRSACPYRGAPGLSPQTQSWARHRTGHEEALRKQRAQLEYIIFIKHFIIIILLMDVVVWWYESSFMVSKHNLWCQIDAKAIEAETEKIYFPQTLFRKTQRTVSYVHLFFPLCVVALRVQPVPAH